MSEPCYRLLALHGFLGRASDWTSVAGWFPDATIEAIDLWAMLAQPGADDWASSSAALDRRLAAACGGGEDVPAFVLAYSFGARLALSSALLASSASPVRGTCFVSCHPGLADGDVASRDARRVSDDAWAQRLLTSPEQDIWREWDAQSVFSGGPAPSRTEGLPASRASLARALRVCSLAGQPDGRARLCEWRHPVLWVTGARDAKFVAIADLLRASRIPIEFETCQDAGHRVPWDNPSAFARAVRSWIVRVMERQT